MVFELDFSPHPVLWLLAPAGMAVMVAAAGYVASRKVLRVSPTALLNE